MDGSLHNSIVILSISLLGLVLFIQGYHLSCKGQHFLGAPSIRKAWFITGKISLFSTWGFMLAKAIIPSLHWLLVFPPLPWISVIVLIPGTVITAVSFLNLGISLKVGLPQQETVLKTGGLYRYSRNPLYLGVYLITVASVLYYPDALNIILGLTGIIVHHLITLSEEKFLSERFGQAYEDYKKKVRRYL